MSKDNLIDLMYLFKDGESTSEERAQLFENLAFSRELQDEFHELVCLENTLVCNASVVAPKQGLKTSIFKKAGLATKSASMTYFMNFGLYSLLFVFGFLFNDILKSDIISKAPITQQKDISSLKRSKVTDSPEVTSSFLSAKGESTAPNKTESIISSAPEYISTDISGNKLSDLPTKISYSDISGNSSNLDLVDSKFGTKQYNYPSIAMMEISTLEQIEQNPGFMSNFEMSAANITGLYIFPKRSELANEGRGLNNYSLGLNYKLSDYSHLGVEYGRETFDLFVKTADNLILNKSQYYIVAKYRYSFLNMELLTDLYPYSEFMLGYTSVGPISKTRIGLIWSPQKYIKLYGGIEGTGLRYSYLGDPEITGKLSFNYGIILNL